MNNLDFSSYRGARLLDIQYKNGKTAGKAVRLSIARSAEVVRSLVSQYAGDQVKIEQLYRQILQNTKFELNFDKKLLKKAHTVFAMQQCFRQTPHQSSALDFSDYLVATDGVLVAIRLSATFCPVNSAKHPFRIVREDDLVRSAKLWVRGIVLGKIHGNDIELSLTEDEKISAIQRIKNETPDVLSGFEEWYMDAMRGEIPNRILRLEHQYDISISAIEISETDYMAFRQSLYGALDSIAFASNYKGQLSTVFSKMALLNSAKQSQSIVLPKLLLQIKESSKFDTVKFLPDSGLFGHPFFYIRADKPKLKEFFIIAMSSPKFNMLERNSKARTQRIYPSQTASNRSAAGLGGDLVLTQ